MTRRPFTLADARRAGLSRWHLEGDSWRRIGPGTYVSTRFGETPLLKLEAASRRLPAEGAFSGFSAAWLHGLDVDPCDPVEVIIPKGFGVSARSGMVVRRSALTKREVLRVQGLRATSVLRTLLDICARVTLTEGVVIADMALHARLTTSRELASSLATYTGTPGVSALRSVALHVEPSAESPMETRLRMLLVLAGLPRPEAQVPIRDRWGRIIGRPDLYYQDARLGLEYDGGTHRDSLAEDNRRQNRLLEAGVRLLRFTASDIFNAPEAVVALVRAALNTSAGTGGFARTA
ncbi:MAG TPA: DUF559 domain-containing protein [Candidatus Dormibacteraeota bacterium]